MIEEIDMINTEILYKLMREKSIKSMRELSERTSIPYTTLMYAIGGHDMYVGTIMQIAKYFQIPMDYLVNKSYGAVVLKNDKMIYTDNSSLIEATLRYM